MKNINSLIENDTFNFVGISFWVGDSEVGSMGPFLGKKGFTTDFIANLDINYPTIPILKLALIKLASDKFSTKKFYKKLNHKKEKLLAEDSIIINGFDANERYYKLTFDNFKFLRRQISFTNNKDYFALVFTFDLKDLQQAANLSDRILKSLKIDEIMDDSEFVQSKIDLDYIKEKYNKMFSFF